MGTLGSEHGQGQGRGMARALKCSSVCLVLEMSRIQPRGLRRDTVTKEEAEKCPRSQVGGGLKASAVVSQAAERSVQMRMHHCTWHHKGRWGHDRAHLWEWWG